MAESHRYNFEQKKIEQHTNIQYDSIMGHHPGKSETIGREIRSMLRNWEVGLVIKGDEGTLGRC